MVNFCTVPSEWIRLIHYFRTKRLQKAKRGKRPHMVICYSKRESKEKVVKLWNPADVFKFIQKHSLRLTVDLFSFNVKIDTERTLDKKIWWKKCMVEVSFG